MPPVPPMAEQARNRLLAAASHAADLADGGAPASEAVAKAASASKVQAGHVPILVRAFNTGRAETHRKQASDLVTAAADLDLADTPAVLSIMYPPGLTPAPGVLKTASDNLSAETIQDGIEWSRRFGDPKSPEFRKKVAAAQKGMELDSTATLSSKSTWRAADRERQQILQKQAADHDRLAHDHETLRSSLVKLAAWFRNPTAEPFAEFADNAGRVFGKAGAALAGALKATDPYLARAEPLVNGLPGAVRLSQEPYASAAKCVKLAAALAAAREKVAEADTVRRGRLVEVMTPFMADEPDTVLGPGGKKFATKEAVDLRDVGLGAMFGRMGRNIPTEARTEESVLGQLTDPSHELKIRDANVEANLADTMARQPQLRSEDPSLIADAFNDASVLAPRSVSQPLVLQHILAERASQRGTPMAPDQIDTLLDIEDRLKGRKAPEPKGPAQA